MHDYRSADLDTETRAMLDYANKLTKNPSDVHHDDFQRLKDIGLTDQQILSVVLITCTFNFMTRLADGLGGASGGDGQGRSRVAERSRTRAEVARRAQDVASSISGFNNRT